MNQTQTARFDRLVEAFKGTLDERMPLEDVADELQFVTPSLKVIARSSVSVEDGCHAVKEHVHIGTLEPLYVLGLKRRSKYAYEWMADARLVKNKL